MNTTVFVSPRDVQRGGLRAQDCTLGVLIFLRRFARLVACLSAPSAWLCTNATSDPGCGGGRGGAGGLKNEREERMKELDNMRLPGASSIEQIKGEMQVNFRKYIRLRLAIYMMKQINFRINLDGKCR